MNTLTETDRPPLAVRVVYGARREPDWLTMTYEELLAYREAENRKRAARLARPITGFPDREATIEWQVISLPGRRLTVRVYRPARRAPVAIGRVCRSCCTCTEAGSWAPQRRATG